MTFNLYSKKCGKCNQIYDDQRKFVILEKCKHVVCEQCYKNNLKVNEYSPKTCPICYIPSSEKDCNQKLAENYEFKTCKSFITEKKVNQQSKISQIESTCHWLPKINPEDIPSESQLDCIYRKGKFLGSGAFGDVFSTSRIQRFAIKTFKDQLTMRQMFEARLMKGIDSQYLCKLHDIYKSSDGKYNIIQDYAQFGDLKSYCEKDLNWNVPEDLAKEWLACVVLGLKEFHSRGIIHRDIKPDNILVFKNDEVKIADYGEANVISQEQSTGVYGAIAFASPEMLDGNGNDYSTDIYSLGITFIYLLTQELPTFKDVLNQQWLSSVKGISKEFITLLSRMISYHSKDRPNVVDLMFNPIIAETKTMKEYKKAQNIMTFGDLNLNQQFMSQISKGGIGCNNCSIILCDKCFRKKVQLQFLMLNDKISEANDITIRIEKLIQDTKVQLDGCESFVPYIESQQYVRIFNDSEQMVQESKSDQAKIKKENHFIIPKVSQVILDFTTKDVKTSKHANDNIQRKINTNLDFSHLQNKSKHLPNQLQEQIISTNIFKPKISKPLQFKQLKNESGRMEQLMGNFNVQCFPGQSQRLKNTGFKAFRQFSQVEFRKIVDAEVNRQQGSFLSQHINNFDKKEFKLHPKGSLIDFQNLYASSAFLIFIQSDFGHVFGFYTKVENCQKVNEGIVFTDNNAIIFNFSTSTIHKLSENTKQSMIATDKGMKIGGNTSFKNIDILIDLIYNDTNLNSSFINQSLPDSFKIDTKRSKITYEGTKKFLVQQIEFYHIQ
eukprot:403342882